MKRGPKRNEVRELEMCALYRSGLTLREIGTRYAMTRERVRQLIARHGLTGISGGQHAMTTATHIADCRDKMDRRRAREEKRYAVLGCSPEIFKELTGQEWSWTIYQNGTSKNPGNAYVKQCRAAANRGIEWNITFPEWWAIWQESGHWEQRGRGKGYCMARYGDSGAYEVGNVYVCTIGQNFSDSYLVSPWRERFAGVHAPKLPRDELGMTLRQRQIYDLRQTGLTYRLIASTLGVTEGTVGWELAKARRIVTHPEQAQVS